MRIFANICIYLLIFVNICVYFVIYAYICIYLLRFAYIHIAYIYIYLLIFAILAYICWENAHTLYIFHIFDCCYADMPEYLFEMSHFGSESVTSTCISSHSCILVMFSKCMQHDKGGSRNVGWGLEMEGGSRNPRFSRPPKCTMHLVLVVHH